MSTNTAMFLIRQRDLGRHMVRAMIHLEQPVLVRAVSGPLLQEWMSKSSASIPA